jgi:hypothetical protein
MTDDEWQAHVTLQAARDIGRWLEARGRLDQPIAALGIRDLEAMARTAISRFVVLAAQRIREQPEDGRDLAAILLPPASAPFAAARTGASAIPTSSASSATPPIASAPCPASLPDRP